MPREHYNPEKRAYSSPVPMPANQREDDQKSNVRRSNNRMKSQGRGFKNLLTQHKPLQIVGTINPYCALLAKRAGHRMFYLSGGGVSAVMGQPDMGVIAMADVLHEASRIVEATAMPLLVDIDTGFGGALMIARTVRALCRADIAGVHIEDQIDVKRCGHRPNKRLVDVEEMVARLKVATDAREDDDFVIMARTDALANESEAATLARAAAYVDAGADMIFLEAASTLEQYRLFRETLQVPILANITEFGKTPLFTCEQLAGAGVDMALYPLSAFRAMNQSALEVYHTLLDEGTQQSVLHKMQTREELYEVLDYHRVEQKIDSLLEAGAKKKEK